MKNSTRAVMIDIETLDTTASAVVIQIGAVVFDYDMIGRVKVIAEFERKLPVSTQLAINRTISEDTLKFWMNTPDQQKLLSELLAPGESDHHFDDVLDLIHFCQEHKPSEYWSQGPTFDSIILEHMTDDFGGQVPWKFYQVRDLRTVQKFVGDDAKSKKMKAENSNHNALDDCHSQIKLLQHFIKKVSK